MSSRTRNIIEWLDWSVHKSDSRLICDWCLPRGNTVRRASPQGAVPSIMLHLCWRFTVILLCLRKYHFVSLMRVQQNILYTFSYESNLSLAIKAWSVPISVQYSRLRSHILWLCSLIISLILTLRLWLLLLSARVCRSRRFSNSCWLRSFSFIWLWSLFFSRVWSLSFGRPWSCIIIYTTLVLVVYRTSVLNIYPTSVVPHHHLFEFIQALSHLLNF